MNDKTIVGLIEIVNIIGFGEQKGVLARMDTGATSSAIDLKLASEMKLGPIVASKVIKSAHGTKLRAVVEVEVEICGKRIKKKFSLSDRSHMRYQIIIGQNILKHGFLIDPSKEAPPGVVKK